MEQADTIWNRALGDRTPDWQPGDLALAAALRFHSQAMSGGVLDAVESSGSDELDASVSGFEWLGLGDVAALVTDVRSELADGALEDDRAEELEQAADDRYSELLPSDAELESAFRARLEAEPSAFATA